MNFSTPCYFTSYYTWYSRIDSAKSVPVHPIPAEQCINIGGPSLLSIFSIPIFTKFHKISSSLCEGTPRSGHPSY